MNTKTSASNRPSAREAGKRHRNDYTKLLANRGVDDVGCSICTNDLYRELLGGTADEIRMKRGLPQGANIRDALSGSELAAIGFAEAIVSEIVAANGYHGLDACREATKKAAQIARQAFEQAKKPYVTRH